MPCQEHDRRRGPGSVGRQRQRWPCCGCARRGNGRCRQLPGSRPAPRLRRASAGSARPGRRARRDRVRLPAPGPAMRPHRSARHRDAGSRRDRPGRQAHTGPGGAGRAAVRARYCSRRPARPGSSRYPVRHSPHRQCRGPPPRSPAGSRFPSRGHGHRNRAARQCAPQRESRAAHAGPQRARGVLQPARTKPERRWHLNDQRIHRPSHNLASTLMAIRPAPVNSSRG
jgi:hypothetical protein